MLGVSNFEHSVADTSFNMASVSPASLRNERNEASVLQLGLSWLLRLRWFVVSGQAIALFVAHTLLQLDLPYPWLWVLLGLSAASNAVLVLTPKSADRMWTLPAVLTTDIAVLTLTLALSGGPMNPFTIFFLVHVALAAVLLEAKLAWSLVVLTVCGFGVLFFVPAQCPAHPPGAAWQSHFIGMWIAYVLAAAFVAYFVGRVSHAIRERDRRLAESRTLAAQNERLATLSSFSANAAHELGSPLAAIGIAAKELLLAIRADQAVDSLEPDAVLICGQVARCRSIFADISARAGESMGEMPSYATVGQIIDAVMQHVPAHRGQSLDLAFASEHTRAQVVVVSFRTLVQMLGNLIRNAFEAQNSAGVSDPVQLWVKEDTLLHFHVRDRGAGFVDKVRLRLGEPFVTTKAENGGLGLGLYLVHAFAKRSGGELKIHAIRAGGADVELSIARDTLLSSGLV
jgi:two-component system, sensor histidine kinase RegB